MRTNARTGERFIEFLNARGILFINEPYETSTVACETENRDFLSDLLNDVQRHHRVNLPNSTFRHVLSPIRLIFGRMADIPKCFADYRDDRRFVDRKFSRRANVQRKSRSRPTENSCANLTPLRFCRYFADNDSRFIAGRTGSFHA